MDKRSETRVENQIRFFIHVAECTTDPELVGKSITCTSVDFSAHGLQLRTEQALPVDTILSITIGIGDPFAMYLLSGAIRWARTTSSGAFMGILLQDKEGTDYNVWVASLYALMNPD
jgi:hypothetical protein